jgi:2',3'-cyclic-nucleotide 2'-phosphodiesterase (5'-nucleotidase family)
LQRARALGAPAVIADGGDFVPGEEESLQVERADLMLRAMELMPYDAVGIGERELLLGLDYLEQAAERLPLVSANVRLSGGSGAKIPRVRWVDAEGHRIAVTAYLDPMLFYEWPRAMEIPPERLLVTDPVESLTEVLDTAWIEADLVVVLAHASREQIEDVLARIPPVDVIVQGHEPELARQVGRVQGTLLLRPGPRSRHVALLDLRLSAENELTRLSYQLLDLRHSRRSDPRLEDMVTEFEAIHGSR